MELRQPATASDRDQTFEILRRAFNAPRERRESWDARTPDDALWGLYDGGELLATARVIEWGQFFGGRSVPMAGISGVGVGPHARGRGFATELFRRLLPALRDRGFPISGLHPATTSLYRGVGYEVAASWGEVTLPTRALRSLSRAPHVDVRIATVDDLDAIEACERRVAAQYDGWIDISHAWWDSFRTQFDDFFVYIVDDARGYVIYRQQDDPSWGYRISVEAVIADELDVLLALWHTVASSSSMAPNMTLRNVGPTHPLLLLLPEQDLQPSQELRYMLRMLDVEVAMSARGYGAGVTISADVEIDDPLMGDDCGRWRLSVDGGKGVAERGGDGSVRLSSGAFASLWSGWATPSMLRATGLASGGSARDLEALAAMFAGPTPSVQIFF